MEIWREIAHTGSKYEVSSLGQIRNKKTKYILSPEVTKKGYLRIKLGSTGIRKMVHIIVAEAFIGDKPSPTHQINHKDLNKKNNSVDNLEWVTPSENMKHAFDNQPEEKQDNRRKHMSNIGKIHGAQNSKKHTRKPVHQIDKNTGAILGTFESAREASAVTGACYKKISAVCRGTRITHMGYKWRFVND